MHFIIYEDYSDEGLIITRKLFTEYADSLGFPLDFQDFEKEIKNLPGDYSPPEGCLLLCKIKKKPAGCIALRKLAKGICELKRMYVKSKFRDQGIGKRLAREVIKRARLVGYKKMRLDSLQSMKTALHIYRKLGFKKIPPYRYNPFQDAVYLELEL